MSDSEVITQGPCDSCGSSDANTLYSDGHTHCFSCGEHINEAGEVQQTDFKKTNLLSVEYQSLSARKLSKETCEKFRYGVAVFKDKPVQVAYYRNLDNSPKQKLRFKDKDFTIIGNKGKSQLFGQHLWNGGRRLVITEGEIDAMSISQTQGNTWPVVSVPDGAQSAAKSIANNIEFIDQFEEVVFCFDMDEHGRKPLESCCRLIENGKAFIAELPLKDANEMLKAGRIKELQSCLWSAKPFRIDGIIGVKDVKDKALEKIPLGIEWPWKSMTNITKGRHAGRVYTFGAGTGIGKTDILTQIVESTLNKTEDNFGLIYLEQPPAETLKRLAGKRDKVLYHLSGNKYEEKKLSETLDSFVDRLFMYDHFGAIDWSTIKSAIRSLVIDCNCKHIVLDHLTALAAYATNERELLEKVMADISELAKKHNIYFYLISHLATPEGTPHEEGGRVMLRHMKGSRSIGFWSHYTFGFERNQQHSDINIRHTTLIRCLKDRVLGTGVGQVFAVKYDSATGYLNETKVPDSILESTKRKSTITTNDLQTTTTMADTYGF